jgi:TolA-binding protein
VQDLQLLQESLTADSGATQQGKGSRLRAVHFGWLAAAAAAILAFVLWPAARSTSSRSAETTAAIPAPAPAPVVAPAPRIVQEGTLAQLVAVTPPRYIALPVRSDADADTKAFDAGMKRYAAGDYDAAVRQLAPVVARARQMPHAAFFLGVSELMTNDLDGARAALQKAAASRTSPYADEAHFYLAKICLRSGDADGAIRELEIAERQGAGPAGEAGRLLTALRARQR